MPKNEHDEDKEKALEIDFGDFEKQIDDEIDRLFVPLASQVDTPLEGLAAGEETRLEAKPTKPAPAIGELRMEGEPPKRAPAVDELRLEVEPAKRAPAAQIDQSLKAPTPLAVEEGIRAERDYGIELKAVEPKAAKVDREKRPATEPVASPDRTELLQLVESFNVAYLSLDWDYSAGNVAKLDSALGKLWPYCQQANEARSLYKILKVILLQLNTETEPAAPRIIELVRDSQDLLKDLLLTRADSTPRHQEQYKSLIERARILRQEGFLGKKSAAEPPVEKRPPAEMERREAFEVALPVEAVGALDFQNLRELRKWLESSRDRWSSAAQKLQEDSRLLSQVEQVLARTPVLAPVVARLGKVRSGMEGCALSLQENDRQWEGRIQWLVNFEASIQDSPERAAEQVSAPEPVLEIIEPGPAPPPAEEPQQPAPVTRQEMVCSYRLSGRLFAVLAARVVKIAEVSADKANKIRERGYATLGDFKPFLRSIRTGVMGEWSELSGQALKSYQFLPLPYQLLRAPGVPSIAGTAILVSNGSKHGIIFAEPTGVKFGEETITCKEGEKGLMGVMTSEAGSSIEVLNIDEILETPNA